MEPMQISANLVSPFTGIPQPATVTLDNGRIAAIAPAPGPFATYLLPGFIDAHVHIESSMLVPAAFARLAVTHGTVATVSDPHEIANVLGTPGVTFMADNARGLPFTFWWGAPSCVPATKFETAGATLSAADVETLFATGACHYLSEVMNFPGVLAGDPDLLAKLAAARRRGLPIDGHAPGLTGQAATQYFSPATGITTDHECVALDEALFKIECGAKILIREGSAAKNFDALRDLLNTHPDRAMLCSDDKHPDDLLLGHINLLVNRALAAGVPLKNILRAACINPVEHYRLPVGLLRVGDPADFIETDSLTDFSHAHILRTFIRGQPVADHGRSLLPAAPPAQTPNAFHARPHRPEDFRIRATASQMRVIEALDGQLITRHLSEAPTVVEDFAVADPRRDLLKIAVINRYAPHAPAAVGFIRGFGLKRGALASSVAHDSHNIVAVGTSDAALAHAVNRVIANTGGLAATDGDHDESLPLPVAGLMSPEPGETVGTKYAALQHMAVDSLGTALRAPFMTLSFMALLVIPSLKMSDKGLFDGERFAMTELFG
jgi:adenine deaminase